MPQNARYVAKSPAILADGWQIERLTPPSRLYGANGLRTGPDGRIYVAQVPGSQVSAINVDTGEIEAISPMGGEIVAPDDIVFDEAGNLYVTEITEGRVAMMTPRGEVRVIQGDMPVANPITYYQGRLLAGECRPGGRIMELDRNGGAPRIILEDVPMANAFEVGPDGKLYFPVMGTNEIWRVSLDGGAPEVVAGNLGVPDSVKFDSRGFIVSTQVASGQVLRIDPTNGDHTVLANLTPGLDNVTFVGDRIFVSSIPGEVFEILEGGQFRSIVEKGLQWPLGLAVDGEGGLFIADGGFTYTLQPGGRPEIAGMLFSPGFPGYTRGVAAAGKGEWLVTTANGQLSLFWPARQESQELASGYDQLMDVAVAPDGGIVFAEFGGGRVLAFENGAATELASGLDKPTGVAVGSDGTVYVAEAGAGRVVKLAGGRAEVVLDGLKEPHGIAVRGDRLYVVDALAKTVAEHDLGTGVTRTLASGLAVGAPAGVTAKFLGPVGTLSGSMNSFTGLAVGGDGSLYVSADAEGSVLLLKQA